MGNKVNGTIRNMPVADIQVCTIKDNDIYAIIENDGLEELVIQTPDVNFCVCCGAPLTKAYDGKCEYCRSQHVLKKI